MILFVFRDLLTCKNNSFSGHRHFRDIVQKAASDSDLHYLLIHEFLSKINLT